MGLTETYDEDLLFSFNFSQNTRVPRLPEFADWAQEQSDASAIAFDKGFCEMMIQKIGPQLEGKIPVSRGQGFLGGGGWRSALLPSLIYTLSYSPSHPPHLSGFLVLPWGLSFFC